MSSALIRMASTVTTTALVARRELGITVLQSLAELLIDCEEDRTLRAVPVGMLREGFFS